MLHSNIYFSSFSPFAKLLPSPLQCNIPTLPSTHLYNISINQYHTHAHLAPSTTPPSLAWSDFQTRLGSEAGGRDGGAIRDRLLRWEAPSRLHHAGGDAPGREACSRLRRCKTKATPPNSLLISYSRAIYHVVYALYVFFCCSTHFSGCGDASAISFEPCLPSSRS